MKISQQIPSEAPGCERGFVTCFLRVPQAVGLNCSRHAVQESMLQTKPLTQPAAPGCTYIRENITASLKKLHVGVLDIYIFDSQSSRKTATCSNQQINLSSPLKIREVLARTFLPRERGPGRRRRGRHCASGRPRRPPPPLPLSGTSERTPLGRRPEGRHTNYTYRVVHQAMHRLLLIDTYM